MKKGIRSPTVLPMGKPKPGKPVPVYALRIVDWDHVCARKGCTVHYRARRNKLYCEDYCRVRGNREKAS